MSDEYRIGIHIDKFDLSHEWVNIFSEVRSVPEEEIEEFLWAEIERIHNYIKAVKVERRKSS
jgi:hypothetical protein